MGLSIWHLLVVVLVFMLMFGTKRLPGAMEDMAKGLKAFKKGLKDENGPDEIKQIELVKTASREE